MKCVWISSFLLNEKVRKNAHGTVFKCVGGVMTPPYNRKARNKYGKENFHCN